MNDFLELTQGLIDSNDFDDKPSFEDIPAGDYRIEVSSVETRTSQSGNDYISMMLTIIDGDFNGRKIFNRLFFTVKTAEKTIKRIYKLGQLAEIEPVPFTDVDSIKNYLSQLVGNAFVIHYDEEAFNRVDFKESL